jgi:hypothetical protein
LRQSLDQQNARGGRGERPWQRSGEALEPGGYRAEERSEAASLLPEARGESMAESHREQERLESPRGDRLPWERGERLDQIREGREGRRAERRSQHGKTAKERRRSLASARDNRKERRESQRRGAGLSQLFTIRLCALLITIRISISKSWRS